MTLKEFIEALETADVAGTDDAPVRVVLRKPDTNEGLQYELIGVQSTDGWDSPIGVNLRGGTRRLDGLANQDLAAPPVLGLAIGVPTAVRGIDQPDLLTRRPRR